MSVSSADECVGGREEDLRAVRGHARVAHARGGARGEVDRVRRGADVHVGVDVFVARRVGRDFGRGDDPRAVGGDVELGDRAGERVPVLVGGDDLRRARGEVAVIDGEVRPAGVGAGLEGVFGGEDQVLAVAGEELGDLAFGFGGVRHRGGERAAHPLDQLSAREAAPGCRFSAPRRSTGCRGSGPAKARVLERRDRLRRGPRRRCRQRG